jgi:hypothetical protein
MIEKRFKASELSQRMMSHLNSILGDAGVDYPTMTDLLGTSVTVSVDNDTFKSNRDAQGKFAAILSSELRSVDPGMTIFSSEEFGKSFLEDVMERITANHDLCSGEEAEEIFWYYMNHDVYLNIGVNTPNLSMGAKEALVWIVKDVLCKIVKSKSPDEKSAKEEMPEFSDPLLGCIIKEMDRPDMRISSIQIKPQQHDGDRCSLTIEWEPGSKN